MLALNDHVKLVPMTNVYYNSLLWMSTLNPISRSRSELAPTTKLAVNDHGKPYFPFRCDSRLTPTLPHWCPRRPPIQPDQWNAPFRCYSQTGRRPSISTKTASLETGLNWIWVLATRSSYVHIIWSSKQFYNLICCSFSFIIFCFVFHCS